jgi:hypothetical protein
LKTVHLVIVCVTILIALWIWKGTDHTAPVAPPAGTKPVEINLSAMQMVIKQDRELAAVMQVKRKEVPANTDAGLNTIGLLVKAYATHGLRINLTACPRDFAEAYIQVFTAWQKEAETIASHPHIPDGSGPIVEGFFRNLDQDVIDTMTEPPDGMTDWFEEMTSAENKIHSAQQGVLSLIARYGVRSSQ